MARSTSNEELIEIQKNLDAKDNIMTRGDFRWI